MLHYVHFMQHALCTVNLADKSSPHAHVTHDCHVTNDHFTVQILYGILLTRRKEYIDHPITRRFHVRVLIPCYSESLEIVSATALAARRATLPPGVRRTGISLSVSVYDHAKGRSTLWGQAYKY